MTLVISVLSPSPFCITHTDIVCRLIAGTLKLIDINHGLNHLWRDTKLFSPVHPHLLLGDREDVAHKVRGFDPWKNQKTTIADTPTAPLHW